MADAVDLGPYTLDKLMSTGTHAQVWLAKGPSGEVALKVARSDAHRFAIEREHKALQLASHPRIVRVLDAGKGWIAMERVRGVAIDRWAEKRSIREIVAAVADIVDAVRHLHGHGVVHGDIKPANVLVDRDDRPKLLDLGLATLDDEEVKGFRGTLGYAAPEVLRGESPGRRADVYGLGALLYTCLTGHKPFETPDPAALTWVPLTSLPAPPSTHRAGLPSALDGVVLEMLARDKTRRPKSLPRVQKDLLAALKSPVGMPVLGMHEEREALRRAVVAASEGESRVVVVYGPPGCGRSTLLGEAVQAAQREGMVYVEAREVAGGLDALATPDGRPVVTFEGGAVEPLAAILHNRVPGLYLVRASRALPELGATALQLTPPPLAEEDGLRLVAFLEGDPQQAARWWRESLGHPVALVGRVRAWRREKAGAPPDTSLLPETSRAVLEWLRASGPSTLPVVAGALGLGEHALLDHCEVLFAERLVVAQDDGAVIAAAEVP